MDGKGADTNIIGFEDGREFKTKKKKAHISPALLVPALPS